MTIRLAFHFKANSEGFNFTCDPNEDFTSLLAQYPDADTYLLNANNYINLLINNNDGMNGEFQEALIDAVQDASGKWIFDGNMYDTRIRFMPVNGDICSSSFFYESNENFIDIPDALNIRFFENPSASYTGATNYGSNVIRIPNRLVRGGQGILFGGVHFDISAAISAYPLRAGPPGCTTSVSSGAGSGSPDKR